MSGILVDLRRDQRDLRIELLIEIVEDPSVERDAGQLHLDEDRDQRQFKFAVELVQDVILGQLRQQEVGQAEGDVGVGGGVLACFLGGDVDHRFLIASLADQVLDRGHLDAEFAQGERFEADVGLVQHEGGDHRVVVETAHVDPVAAQHFHIELGIVQQFGNERVLEHWPERRLDQLVIELGLVAAMSDRDVAALTCFVRQGVAGDLAVDRVGG